MVARVTAFLALGVMLALTFGQVGQAGGMPVVNETTVTRDLTSTSPDSSPCTGVPAINTGTGQTTAHITAFVDGTVHVVMAIHSAFTVDAIDPTEEDFSGHESDHFSFQGTNGAASTTATFTPVSVGTHGTRLVGHLVAHVTVTARGEVSVSFERFTFRGCP
jgi:hypothetical protein